MLEYDEEGYLKIDTSLFDESHASLSRDTGAGILEMIASATESKPVPIVNDFEFINEPLFCEWAWVVDLDEEVLEAFNNKSENFVDRFTQHGGGKLGLKGACTFAEVQSKKAYLFLERLNEGGPEEEE